MLKKIIASVLLALFLFKFTFVYSLETINSSFLYYLDKDSNWKIDTLQIVFDKELTWSLDYSKLFLYSNTWWLSTSKLDWVNNIFSNYSLSWNTLILDILEQDNYLTWLTVNNSTLSHLRLKTNSWVWIKDLSWNEIKLLYWTSFDSYKNVFFKENIVDTLIETSSWSLSETWILDSQSWTLLQTWVLLETNSWILLENSSWTSIENQKINTKINFQSPSYLLDKEKDTNIYYCDNSKTDCKVNFNLQMNIWSWFLNISNTKYNCEWNFGIDDYFEEKYKCNPTTIVYPDWNFDVNYIITDILSWEKYSKNFKIINTWYKEESNTKIIYSTRTETITKEVLYIEEPKIEIQSWLDDKNICKKYDCNLNLSYTPKNTKERCKWDFWWWIYDVWGQDKCNPWYIKYGKWNFEIKLKVFESWNETNFKESKLKIENNFLSNEMHENINNIETSTWSEIIENNNIEKKDTIKAKIKLQWTIWWKDKKLLWNYLFCYKEECSINLSWEDSYSFSWKISYNWDFWNWLFDNSKNPKSIIYKLWNYKIILEISDDFWNKSVDYFFVEVLWENKEGNKLNENWSNIFSSWVIVSWVLPNPSWSDHIEYIELKNISDKKINLNNCKIDDKIKWWSKEYVIDKDIFLEPWKTKKFFSFETHIKLKNTSWDEVNLTCNWQLYDHIKWFFDTKDDILIDKNLIEIYNNSKIKTKILKIIDWDTFEIDLFWKKYKLRLIWVDTPETKHPQKEIQQYGIEAYNFSKNLEDKEVFLIIDKNNFIDSYWRLLWYISLNNWKTYNELLLEKWYSKLYDKYDFEYKNIFEISQQIAKNAKIWLWSEKQINIEKIDFSQDYQTQTWDTVKEEINNKIEIIDNIKEILQNTSSWELVLEKPIKIEELTIFLKKLKFQKND